jgi:hypothetical protein
MGALDRLVGRVRANPWMAVAFAGGALLVAAWLAWAVYVASDRGVNRGLGVLIAWPAILIALALISLPIIGGYLLVKRLSTLDRGGEGAGPSADSEPEGAGRR